MSEDKKIYLLKETAEFNFVKETDEKGSPKVSSYGNMLVKGILQKADTLNQNGRIYPKDILEKEVENYRKLIKERRALGECVDDQTEILTYNGWKLIKDISSNEKIYTLNLQTEEIQLQKIQRKVEMDFNGKMIRFSNDEKIDMQLTPNHKMIVWDKKHKPYKILAKDAMENNLNKNSIFSHSYVEEFSHCKTKSTNRFQINYIEHVNLKVETVPYKGKVYCVTVPNGTWMMRRNGKMSWTGNCDHAEEAVVNLKHTSHVITDIWWEGNEVWGQIEILEDMIQGQQIKTLFKNGIKVGISSRAIGSVKTMGGVNYVQEDLQLICWDFVSEPSTPGAFMFAEARQLSNFELKKLQDSLSKTDKINRIANDLLGIKKI